MAGKRGHPRPAYSTWKKTVWLSPECLDLIAAWRARQPGTTLSSAVETLVRLGLQQEIPTAYAAPLEAACRAAVKEEMARTTALLEAQPDERLDRAADGRARLPRPPGRDQVEALRG